MKSSKVSIKTRSTPTSLSFKGHATNSLRGRRNRGRGRGARKPRKNEASSLPFPFPDYAGHAGYATKHTTVKWSIVTGTTKFEYITGLQIIIGHWTLAEQN